MKALWFAALATVSGTGQMQDVLRQDFRGGHFPREVFSFFAASAKVAPFVKTNVLPDAGGVRITLPAREQPIGMIGFACRLPVADDFEITLAYELVGADGPVGGYGMGLTLWAVADTPSSDIATIGRRIVPKQGHFYGTDRLYYNAEKKDIHDAKRFETSESRGRLRLARVGAEVVYSAAGEKEIELRELRRAAYPSEKLREIRVTADTGNGLGDMEILVSDLQVRSAVAAAAPLPTAAAPPVPDAGTRRGVFIALGALLAALLAAAGGTWWMTRRRTQDRPPK